MVLVEKLLALCVLTNCSLTKLFTILFDKAVGESTRLPLKYYETNLGGTFVLLRLMDEFKCHSIVFSSSATVYGAAEKMPITESATVGAGITNAYGRSKYMIEEILRDFHNSKTLDNDKTTDWSVAILRYVLYQSCFKAVVFDQITPHF